MDRLADGARVLIDYKTGVATADWRGERPDNPQLPIYALLQPASAGRRRLWPGECRRVRLRRRSGTAGDLQAERPEIAARRHAEPRGADRCVVAAHREYGRGFRGRPGRGCADLARLQDLPAARIVPRAGGARGCGDAHD